MNTILNILHLPNDYEYPHRAVRQESFRKQAAEHGIEINVWDGVLDKKTPRKAILAGHKKIVQWAKDNNLANAIIAEDDFSLFAPGAWQYFLSKIPEVYELFLSMCYDGKWDENGKVTTQFSGMTMYSIHQQFYDYFLSCPDGEHIDRWLNLYPDQRKIYVCLPFVAEQLDGFSDNSRRVCEYKSKLVGKPLFKRQ